MAAPASEKQHNWCVKVSFGDEIKEMCGVIAVNVDRAGTLVISGRRRGATPSANLFGMKFDHADEWTVGFAAGKWDTYKIE